MGAPLKNLSAADKSFDRVVRIFQSEGDEVIERRIPFRARATLVLLAAMLAGFLALSTAFDVDRVVTSSHGQLVTVDPNIVIQPLDPSIVKTIEVHEGDLVRKGQRLATLDPTLTTADVNAMRAQFASYDAETARCEAEVSGKPFVYDAPPAPGGVDYGAMQRALYAQRKSQFDAQIQAYDQQIGQMKATLVKYANSKAQSQERLTIASQIERMYTTLQAKDSGSQLQLLTSRDTSVQMRQSIALDDDSIEETRHQIEATQATREAFIQQWRAQSSQELVTARNQLETVRQSLEKALKHQELVVINAADDALVLSIAKKSVGSVLQPTETFIELAPLNSKLEADILIDPLEVGFVRPGDSSVLKLDPYNFVEHGTVQGQLRWVSQGTFTQSQSGTAGSLQSLATAGPDSANVPSGDSGAGGPVYYRARISIQKVDLHDVPSDFRLLPGTTLAADIHVGTRSLFWYLARGFVRGWSEAMREP